MLFASSKCSLYLMQIKRQVKSILYFTQEKRQVKANVK